MPDFGWIPIDPRVVDAARAALQHAGSAGAVLDDVDVRLDHPFGDGSMLAALQVGVADRSWNLKGSDWRDIPRQTDLSTSSMLRRQYFCPHNDPIQSSAEGVDALRKGGHPMVYLPENYNRR